MVYLTVQLGFVLLEGKIVFVRDDVEDVEVVEWIDAAEEEQESGGVRRWLKLWLWVERDDEDVGELEDVLSQDVRVEDVEGFEGEGLMKRASKSCS